MQYGPTLSTGLLDSEQSIQHRTNKYKTLLNCK